MDSAQARTEAVVTHHHDAGASLGRKLAKLADCIIQAADHLGRRRVPFGACSTPVSSTFK